MTVYKDTTLAVQSTLFYDKKDAQLGHYNGWEIAKAFVMNNILLIY